MLHKIFNGIHKNYEKKINDHPAVHLHLYTRTVFKIIIILLYIYLLQSSIYNCILE